MSQFRYRLQTLLDRKTQARDEAQQTLSAAQQDLRREQDELESCRRSERDSVDRLCRARADLLSPGGDWNGEALHLRRVHVQRVEHERRAAGDEVRTQELSVAEAGERLAAARQALADRSREVEALEKHRSRLERRFNEEAARKEALEQEEMATVVFLRGRGER